MKIAFVYDAVYPWVKGGAEKRIYELGKRLAERGNEVHVFGIKWWEGADVIEYDGMALHGVCGPMKLYVNGRRSISEALIFSIRLLPHLIKERFNVIDVCAFPYFSCFSAKIASIAGGSPMIITWHEVWKDYWYDYLGIWGFFGKVVEILVSKLTDKPIAVSEMTKTGLESLGVDGHNIAVLPNGVDLKDIDRIPPSLYKCDIIFVGRLIKDKNVDLLIEAIAYVKEAMPEITSRIIGDGPEKEHLGGLVVQHGMTDNIIFSGFMEHNEVIARIKSSKVLVLPSSREGFGIAVIEAFACGVPVVTVSAPRNAASELVDRKTGIIVKPDIKDLANALIVLVSDDKLRGGMSGSAKKAVQEYEWDNIVGQLTNLYEELK